MARVLIQRGGQEGSSDKNEGILKRRFARMLAQGSVHQASEDATLEDMLQVYNGKIKEGGSSDLHS